MNQENDFKASLSTLILSIGSAAMMALGEAPHPDTGKIEQDLKMAKFNIELLDLLKEKTVNNLTKEEDQLIAQILNDLKLKFVKLNKST
ncbi:MAG: DUF1844 domain-containing protein [Bdellovibrionaceae bacterium]|jgi:hypothetical protein|nr:DUF1844 domain-containing protein [Pseudobdellovibrionaceae bacterium]